MDSISIHVSRLGSLGFSSESIASFEDQWKSLADDGFEVYGLYTGIVGSRLEAQRACVICSASNLNLKWQKVITPSMDSAAIYCVCEACDSQYVEGALRQKALGRLLKERNTRPS